MALELMSTKTLAEVEQMLDGGSTKEQVISYLKMRYRITDSHAKRYFSLASTRELERDSSGKLRGNLLRMASSQFKKWRSA